MMHAVRILIRRYLQEQEHVHLPGCGSGQLDGVYWALCEELREQLVCAYPS